MNADLVLCRGGRDFVEISPRECAIVASALSTLLQSAIDAGSNEFAGEVDTLARLFLGPAGDKRVESLLMFCLAKGSSRTLYKLAEGAKTGRNGGARARRAGRTWRPQ